MKKSKTILSILFLIFLTSSSLFAENINNVVIGGKYYLKGFFSENKVTALDVNHFTNKVKIIKLNSKEVDWVYASKLITFSESLDRDMNRLEAAATIFEHLFSQPQNQSTWKQGLSIQGIHMCTLDSKK